ncbi:hypothetical protein CDL12_05217 [Handroanthus impetiginosus]|uniref:Uncharacterized protein n=1 Tax=Handroanthus impetiginosus TaxID=429701 RepID=A0A2G9HX63_9LAMI|nr:hypothetical protein CDL12_05217 [Handroanthus impetiginosus]
MFMGSTGLKMLREVMMTVTFPVIALFVLIPCPLSCRYHLKVESRVPVWRSYSNLGSGGDKTKSKSRKSHDRSPKSILCGKQGHMKGRRFAPVGLTGCMMGGSESPVVETHTTTSCRSSFRSNGAPQKDAEEIRDICNTPIIYSTITAAKLSFFNSKRQLLNAPPSTLGYSALARTMQISSY